MVVVVFVIVVMVAVANIGVIAFRGPSGLAVECLSRRHMSSTVSTYNNGWRLLPSPLPPLPFPPAAPAYEGRTKEEEVCTLVDEAIVCTVTTVQHHGSGCRSQLL